MILGIGTDMVDTRRIEALLSRYGKRFEDKVFTLNEQAMAGLRKGARQQSKAAFYAKRFAAKEACVKALVTREIGWHDIEVVHNETGAPGLQVRGGALARLHGLLPGGMQAQWHLSLADEYPYALAYVIIAAIKEP